MKMCKNILYFIIAVILIALGIGIFLGKIFGFFIYIIALLLIVAGVYILFIY